YGGLVAVGGVSFSIGHGETYGLLGPNGAGKTTTISIVCGLLQSDAGQVFVDGVELTPKSVGAKAAIGLVPQDIAVYPDLTGRENLQFFASLYGIRGKKAKARIDEVLDIIGLTDRAGDAAKEYSGGMKRRLNIGIGLLHQPKLLILDEPTVGVDPQSRNAILSAVAQLSDGGMAVLYTTHYMEEAERLCDRVGIIDGGKLQAEGTRSELVALVGEHDHISLLATGDLAAGAEAAAQVPGVRDASINGEGLDLIVDHARSSLPEIMSGVVAAGLSVRSVEVREPDLEAVFLHLTGKALRD
ncbi:MAG: ABC transporter ATP-binding protein, partial [Dehalococcoidia bacterium]